ncbi:flagellar hook-length control protein FliK [Thioclava pacifica]|uniref:Flagellar hook-length control protein-like C-terminal domain-containing protein n=1 Tax=Thioclava pacifica DSM 10166 TaxID=1353537 RepID=A0A074J9H5_9RHOB|nr:flagellar hook-length control protein FliK [Thioclava pacifica]KEO54241.1 hypothetical protein TP2_04780 [Thioclava pacifica DSM 10166]
MIPFSLIESVMAPHPEKTMFASDTQMAGEPFRAAFDGTAGIAPGSLLQRSETAAFAFTAELRLEEEEHVATFEDTSSLIAQDKKGESGETKAKTTSTEKGLADIAADRSSAQIPQPGIAEMVSLRAAILPPSDANRVEPKPLHSSKEPKSDEDNAGISETPSPVPALTAPLLPDSREMPHGDRKLSAIPLGSAPEMTTQTTGRSLGTPQTEMGWATEVSSAISLPEQSGADAEQNVALVETPGIETRPTTANPAQPIDMNSEIVSTPISSLPASQPEQGAVEATAGSPSQTQNMMPRAQESDHRHQIAEPTQPAQSTQKPEMAGTIDASEHIGFANPGAQSIHTFVDRGTALRKAADPVIAQLVPSVSPLAAPTQSQPSDAPPVQTETLVSALAPGAAQPATANPIEPKIEGEAASEPSQDAPHTTSVHARLRPQPGVVSESSAQDHLVFRPETLRADGPRDVSAPPVISKAILEHGDGLTDLRAPAFDPPFARPDLPAATAPEQLRPTSAPSTPALAQAVGQQIGTALAQMPDQPVEISLSPEELGRVRLTLHGHDQSMTVAVQAERPETLDLMRRHIDSLAREMRDLGYVTLNFTFDQNRGRNAFAQRERSDEGQDWLSPQVPELAERPPARFVPIHSAASGLDLRM